MVDMTIPEEQVVTGTIEDAINKLKQKHLKEGKEFKPSSTMTQFEK